MALADDPKTWPREPVVTLEPAFADVRGSIQPLVERLMGSALVIRSVKGALRANHYHKTDWHYSYMLEGAMEYYHRPRGSEGEPKLLVVRAGQLIFTPPMVEHAMRFTQDSALLALSRNPRDRKAYEEDVVRVALIDG